MILKRIDILILVLTVLAIVPSGWAETGASGPQVRLVQEQGPLKVIQAQVLVDAPVSTVWQELSNYGNLKNVLPGYQRSTVLQSAGPVKTVDFLVKANAFLPVLHYQVRISEHKAQNRFHIQRIAGDLKEIDAVYQLIPVDGGSHTRVIYTLNVDVGKSLPPFGVSSALTSSTARGMTALQAHCEDVHRRELTAQAAR